MNQLSLNEIVNATNGKIKKSSIPNRESAIVFNGISTDSRTVKREDIFFALKGPNYDGHNFVNDAINNGAKGAVVDCGLRIADCGFNAERSSISNPKSEIENCLIHVSDTKEALGDLAKYYRKKMPAKIVAITGSNGKTTTKDMVYHLLAKKFDAVKSKASYNNFIGVPLTIFDLDTSHKFGVVEMGTNAFGEIRRLSEIASPDVAVITNIAETHLEGLKNIDGVKKAKAEILENIKDDGLLLVNSDDELALEIGKESQREFIGFGLDKYAKVSASRINHTIQGWSFIINETHRVSLPFSGYYNIFNCLAAFAVVFSLGIEIENIDDVFNDFQLSPMRMDKETITISNEGSYNQDGSNQISAIENSKVTVINDAYNANPSSMRAVIHDFGMMRCRGRRIFVSGDMLELGAESESLHFEVGKEIGQSAVDILWAVGKMATVVVNGALEAGMPIENILCFEVLEDLFNSALPSLKMNDTILLKGSRAMKLEKLAAEIKSYSQMKFHLLAG